MIGIVVSRADPASTHIGTQLRARGEWTAHEDSSRPDGDGGGTYYRTEEFELREFDSIHVELDRPETVFSTPDQIAFLVFVSRHAGETGPLLTAHFTGNFGPAEYGGDPGAFARAAPEAQKAVVAALADHAPAGYDVGIECTHHGPTACSVPSMFVELGSTDEQWRDSDGAAAVAAAVRSLGGVSPDRRRYRDEPPRHVVGFGGGHYTPRCTRIITDSEWAVGHIGSEWQLDAMAPETDCEVIDAAFEASAAELAVVSGTNPELEAVIEDLGYRVVSETWLQTVGTRRLDVVSAAESALSPVEDGLRFGTVELPADAETDATETWKIVDLPDDLLAAVHGLDADMLWSAVVDTTIAFETVEGATLPAGRAVVASEADFDRLVDTVADRLAEKYETVERTPEAVVCRQHGFDPDKAATLGVPEGPKFGRLAAGEPIELNGRTIKPHVVETERVERFSISNSAGENTDLRRSDDCLTNGER